jgi:hypothetical protein
MKKYPLFIECCREFEGYFILGYYSKGHHDKKEFLDAVMGTYKYKGNMKDVYHLYAKLTPAPEGGVMMNYRKQPCRGSFPVTVIDVID